MPDVVRISRGTVLEEWERGTLAVSWTLDALMTALQALRRRGAGIRFDALERLTPDPPRLAEALVRCRLAFWPTQA